MNASLALPFGVFGVGVSEFNGSDRLGLTVMALRTVVFGNFLVELSLSVDAGANER